MTCRVAQQLISRYLDDALSPGARQALVDHLDVCPECRQAVEHARAARDALQHLAANDLPVPEGLCERIKSALQAVHEQSEISAASGSAPVGSPAFVATCASLLIGAVMFYVVTTQVYMRSLEDMTIRAGKPPVVVISSRALAPAGPDGPGTPVAGPSLAMLAASAHRAATEPSSGSGEDPPATTGLATPRTPRAYAAVPAATRPHPGPGGAPRAVASRALEVAVVSAGTPVAVTTYSALRANAPDQPVRSSRTARPSGVERGRLGYGADAARTARLPQAPTSAPAGNGIALAAAPSTTPLAASQPERGEPADQTASSDAKGPDPRLGETVVAGFVASCVLESYVSHRMAAGGTPARSGALADLRAVSLDSAVGQ